MSPTPEPKRADRLAAALPPSAKSRGPAIEPFLSPLGGVEESGVFDDARWKVQRKIKHQRDQVLKRGAKHEHGEPTATTGKHYRAPKGHSTSGPGSANGGGHARDRSAASPPHGHHHDQSKSRNIPGRRKDKLVSSPILLSKSVPSSRSWPPGADLSRLDDAALLENLDPNWELDGSTTPMATSAPESSFLGRSHGSKREARTMTLFESASIFNEAGHLLSHDDFHEMGSSPEIGSQNRRKAKRRVGRHKTEKKRTDASERMTPDDVVLELMHVLLPDLDVTKELNMAFLGGPRHHGDVFDFDDEETQLSALRRPTIGPQDGKLLDVNVIKFQAALATLLFANRDEVTNLPVFGSTSMNIAESFITSEWINKAMLSVVKWDVIAQYDAFSVFISIFRSMPTHRESLLKSAVGASLAIFDHQGVERPENGSDHRTFVSMKGVVSFLNAVLAVVEYECVEMSDSLGNCPEDINENLDNVCRLQLDAIKLLVRSSPGKTKSDETNQLEKYHEGSDSVEATTYTAIGELIYRLSTFSPPHGEEFLGWMLRKWPQRNVQLQLFFVRFIVGMLTHCMGRGILLPYDLITRAFSRLCSCIRSPHFMISKEASSMCGNLQLMDMYLSRDPSLREQVSAVLHENARSHWNDRIRQMSDEYFDVLLDFA